MKISLRMWLGLGFTWLGLTTLSVAEESRYLDLASVCEGRLTLTSGTSVTTSDVTGATSIFYTPHTGAKISLYDGTRWKLYSFSEVSLALGTLTASKNYDVFLYDNAGTLALELSAAWASGTARTDALTTVDGVHVKSGATTRRYLGTFYTTSTTTTEDSDASRLVWNRCNRVNRRLLRRDLTSWTWVSASYRPANNSTANRVAIVNGLLGEIIQINVSLNMALTSAGSVYVGVCEDCTNTISQFPCGANGSIGVLFSLCPNVFVPALGYHYYQWTEYGGGGGATSVSMLGVNSGLFGTWAS